MDTIGNLIESYHADISTCCDVTTNATAQLTTRPPYEVVVTHQALWRLMDASYLHPRWPPT